MPGLPIVIEIHPADAIDRMAHDLATALADEPECSGWSAQNWLDLQKQFSERLLNKDFERARTKVGVRYRGLALKGEV